MKAYTEQRIIEAMRNLANRLGAHGLSKRDMEADPESPSAMTAIRCFGSWDKALTAAGLQGGKPGRPPTSIEMPDLFVKYDDAHIFFSKRDIWRLHQKRDRQEIFATAVLPFKDFVRAYIGIHGWIYPPCPSASHMSAILEKLCAEPAKVNTSNVIGSLELKGWFRSFWHANTKTNLPPVEILGNDEITTRLLKYRFGISDSVKYRYVFDGHEVESNELFDISFKQVRRALEVNRYSVSIFKPLLAKWLYERYVMRGATVWDPCAGFGGRLLGAMAAGVGKYIACEPNPRTAEELGLLVDSIGVTDKVSLHFLPLEHMLLDARSVDLVFTSPPYVDKEHYCNDADQSDVKYGSRQAWIDGFLTILIRKATDCLKPQGRLVLVVDASLTEPIIEIASAAGLSFVECLGLRNAATHLTKKDSSEYVVAFQRV